MTGHVARHQVVHHEVERSNLKIVQLLINRFNHYATYLPICPLHSQVPELSRSQLSIVEAVCQYQEAAEYQEERNHQTDPEVEHLEGGED